MNRLRSWTEATSAYTGCSSSCARRVLRRLRSCFGMFDLHFSCVTCSSAEDRVVVSCDFCRLQHRCVGGLPGRTVGSACRRRDVDGERSRGDTRATRYRVKRGHICALVRNPDGTSPLANETPQGFTRPESVIVARPGMSETRFV